MDKILIVTPDTGAMKNLADGLNEGPDVDIEWADSGEKALGKMAEAAPDLVIADENLGDMSGLALINKMVMTNPMINAAAVSSLPEGEFHEKSEGLGVMAHLSPGPSQSDGARLLGKLRDMKRLVSGG